MRQHKYFHRIASLLSSSYSRCHSQVKWELYHDRILARIMYQDALAENRIKLQSQLTNRA